MQTVSQTIENVSYVTGTPRNRVNQLARALISAGILPKSVGRDVKKMDGGQTLGLIAAIAFAENVADAPAVAAGFMALPVKGLDGLQTESDTLGQVFSRSMEYPDWQGARLELAIVASGYTAQINGEAVVGSSLVCGEIPFWIDPSMGGWVKRSFVIDVNGIVILRNLSCRDDADDMTFKSGGTVAE